MQANFVEGPPLKYLQKGIWTDFPIRFRWQTGLWFELFEKHFELVVEDIKRARAGGRLVIYLSCPISSRGGSYSLTNIEISCYVAKRLEMKWGSRFWVLNPTLYQMESGGGVGLIERHAHLLNLEKKLSQKVNLIKLSREFPVTGGDYLRMWSRVLAEDGDKNLGNRFDAFYFMGPSDIRDFFYDSYNLGSVGGLTHWVGNYFAKKFVTNAEFRAYFGEASKREDRERDFFRFYTLKAGAYFSLGSRDEYNIWRILNQLRAQELGNGSEIPAYFDGRQIGFGPPETDSIHGYALEQNHGY